jgi:thiol-disulfide isomerase/thioredoxin
MKNRPICIVALLGFIFSACPVVSLNAQAPTAPTGPSAPGPSAELNRLISTVNDKIKKGQKTEADLGEEIKGFDALLAKYGSQKTDDVAQVLAIKALLYLQVFGDYDKSLVLLNQLKTEYPGTKPSQQADEIIAKVKQMIEARKIPDGLKEGSIFPVFAEQDLDGKPLKLESHRGHVVLVDFWATWCPPCVAEFPNVFAAYQKYHSKGFDIVGISLDEDRAALDKFIKEKGVTWPQFFDGKGWENKLARQYGVVSIPASYLLDSSGKIISVGLRGPALDAQLETLLGK